MIPPKHLERPNWIIVPKDVKCLMANIRKGPKSIETTGIRKAMKEDLAKARKAH
jgi:hypothetical protein